MADGERQEGLELGRGGGEEGGRLAIGTATKLCRRKRREKDGLWLRQSSLWMLMNGRFVVWKVSTKRSKPASSEVLL